MSTGELRLLLVKEFMVKAVFSNEYGVTIPEQYGMNVILIPAENGYKLYVTTGMPDRGTIPFGNDYLFEGDVNGNVTSWKKLHKMMIPKAVHDAEGELITRNVHSHTKEEPFITPTDISTFRLYGVPEGLTTFSVMSPSLGLVLTYDAATDSITSEDIANFR